MRLSSSSLKRRLSTDPWISYGERVLAIAHHHDAADRLACAVELGQAAAHVGTTTDAGDVAQKNGGSTRTDPDRDSAQIVE